MEYAETDLPILFIYLDMVGQTYGWDAIHEIWLKTDGFVHDVDETLSEYHKPENISDEVMRHCIRILRAYPKPGIILGEIENCLDEEYAERPRWYMDIVEHPEKYGDPDDPENFAENNSEEDESDDNGMSDAENAFAYLDVLGQAYGWEVIKLLWHETNGFVTDVKKAFSECETWYELPDGALQNCIRILRAYPDHDAITEEIENCIDESIYKDADNTVTVLESVPGMSDALKKEAEEQRRVEEEDRRFLAKIKADAEKEQKLNQ